MNYWKLGCHWGESKNKLSFYDFIKKESIVIGASDKLYKVGDIVAVSDGFTVKAITRVLENPIVCTQTTFDEEFKLYQIDYDENINVSKVEWIELNDLAFEYKLQAGIREIKKKEILEMINHILKVKEISKKMENLIKLLKFKKQIILQGAPGTGKTYTAEKIAEEMTSTNENYKLIQFHPAYSYEDFVRGIVAESDEKGQIKYTTKNKVLVEFALKASENPTADYVLIIDEINRANLPSVLGELIYALEYRDKPVDSMYSLGGNSEIILPKNLYIIGTMNTADRSVGHIDYAIRRRFAFVDIGADESIISSDKAKQLFETVRTILESNIASDFELKDIEIGHSYYMAKADDELKLKLDYEIKPLLHEYLKDGLLLNGETTKLKIDSLNV